MRFIDGEVLMAVPGDEGNLERRPLERISRRELIGLSASTFAVLGAASTCCAAVGMDAEAKSAPEVSAVMEKLSAYMADAGNRELPEEVAEATKHHVLDTLAAMISGSELLPGRAAVKFSRAYGGSPVATVVATDFLCGPIEAALTNGILAHADETDDSHAPSQSHPGCAVIPAALACAERFQANGARFLRSVALGYDIGSRVTMTLGGQRFEAESHWSTHSIAPLFGAAAAASCAAGLDAAQMRLMLGYAAHQSSGLAAWSRDVSHVQKAFHFGGMTARSGVTSALLIQAGWTGVEDILSGKDNFFAAYNSNADPRGLIDRLGERFEITRTNIKKWPVGSPIQAVLDAIALLRTQHPFEATHVSRIVVRLATDEAAIVNNRPIPDICLQHVVAIMLLDKTVTFATIHDDARMNDKATLKERSKVQLVPDVDLEALMPLRVAIVEVELKNGSHHSLRVDNVRGTPKNPMTRAEIIAKATDLITPILGAEICKQLVQTVLQMEALKDMRELRPLLQKR